MAIQTTYDNVPPIAMVGMLADSSPARECVTRNCEDTAGLQPGLLVREGSRQPFCRAFAATGNIPFLAGCTQYDASAAPGAPHIPQYTPTAILRKGRIWVSPEGVVTDNMDAVYVVHSGANAGRIRADANTAAATLIPFGRVKVIIGAAADGLAMIEINIP